MDPLLFVLIIILVLWLVGGVIVPVGTNAVHLLLIIALLIVVYRLWLSRNRPL